MICGPVVRGRKGYHREIAEGLQRQGFVRARVNGEIRDLREVLKEEGRPAAFPNPRPVIDAGPQP